MTVEAFLMAKHRSEFEKIIKFMRSLVIKNEVEGEAAETTDTASQYRLYKLAFLGTDLSTTYSFTKQQLVDFGFTELQAERYEYDPKAFQTAYMNGNVLCKAFLNSLRKERYGSYIENNQYYRQFCGLPYDESEYIQIKNDDKESDDDPDVIYLHEVNIKDYPKTYSRLFYEREIDKVYSAYSDKGDTYIYLKFIEKPMTPYEVREAEQFKICYYDDTIFESNELQYWLECYEKARNEILLIDYIEAFQYSYNAYVNVELLFILSYTFNLFCASLLEKYAVRDYSDTEIYDILDSNGLSNLKTLNINLLRRIVARLPDLKTYTGTNKVLEIIFDIVADNSLTLKRYYLEKKYTTDLSGNTSIDTESMYDKSVDLVFKEKTILKGSQAQESVDQEYSYEEVAMGDDLWGGTKKISGQSAKLAIKTAMKKELLKADFTSVMTKYIGLSKVIDVTAKMTDLNNKLGIFYQFCDLKGNTISSDSVNYEGIETTALSLFAAWCLVFGTYNDLSDPDYIVKDATTIEGIMKLRTTDKLKADALNVADVVIDLGEGYEKTVGDYLTPEEIEEYLVNFNYSAASTIQDIFDQYEQNQEIIAKIEEKLVGTDISSGTPNYYEYKVWETIYNANMAYHTINDLFRGATSYSQYINSVSENMYNHIVGEIESATTKTDLAKLSDKLYNAFSDYLKKASNNIVSYPLDENSISEGEDLSDIAILFDQFISAYTQLYKQDYNVSYDDPKGNTLMLLWSDAIETFLDEYADFLVLEQKCTLDKLMESGLEEVLELYWAVTDKIIVNFDFEIGFGKRTYIDPETGDVIEEEGWELVKDTFHHFFDEFISVVLEVQKDLFMNDDETTFELKYEKTGDKTQ